MENEIVRVEGMHCAACAERVEDALSDLAGVTAVEADYEAGTVDIAYNPVQIGLQAILDAIIEEGFMVIA